MGKRKKSHEPLVVPFVIVVDGREKAPYGFTGLQADANRNKRPLAVSWMWGHLKSGDYSIKGMEDLVAIERKSKFDLASTLGSHRARFEREHERLAKMQYAAVVIEATWESILKHPPDRSKLNPKTIFRTAMSWEQRYGIHWWTMKNRRLAEVTTFRLLEKFWQHQQEK